jgi:hypothetical protein
MGQNFETYCTDLSSYRVDIRRVNARGSVALFGKVVDSISKGKQGENYKKLTFNVEKFLRGNNIKIL